jgi:putative dimethyl sulfoxide reductase chaperone
MTLDNAIKYAQVYCFLADAFLYPHSNWLVELPYINDILENLGQPAPEYKQLDWNVTLLQAQHRQVFGLTGSMCYESEYGLPHEFRQSQELADISGFYLAFGFNSGGRSRERPDHLAVELEFMYALCLKEAYALSMGRPADAQICRDAQRSFLNDHLASWIGLFAQALDKSASASLDQAVLDGPYPVLGQLTLRFVMAHAGSLGVRPPVRPLTAVKPTPLGPEMSCGDCPLAE